MIIAWLAFFDSLLGVAMVAAGVLGAHWRMMTPLLGLGIFALGSLVGLIALILGLIGIFVTRNPMRAAARPRAVIGTVLGALTVLPLVLIMVTRPKVPPINDITTDFDNPPEFSNAQNLNANHGRDLKYNKAKFADSQLQGYGPLPPLKMPEAPDDAFKAVQRAAAQMPTWTITVNDPAARTIEGYDTSQLFHFNDDFIIVVRPGDGGGSLCEMRSKSRDGIGDLGVNHKRIMDFFAMVQPASSGS
jgi:uncharacterized protein (DUF1499 family)